MDRFLFLGMRIRSYFLLNGTLTTPAAGGEEWGFIKDSQGEEGVFASLIDKAESIGSSGYELLMVIGVIGLVFSIIMTAVTLLLTSNAQKKEEKKSHAFTICIAGVIIFSVFSIIGFFKSIGTGL